MVRAEIFMMDGDKESVNKIEDCDFILTMGFQYKEKGMEIHGGLQGESKKGIIEALACGMVENLKGMEKDRAKKTIALLKFQNAFEEAAKEEVWKMLSEAGEDEEGEETDGKDKE